MQSCVHTSYIHTFSNTFMHTHVIILYSHRYTFIHARIMHGNVQVTTFIDAYVLIPERQG